MHRLIFPIGYLCGGLPFFINRRPVVLAARTPFKISCGIVMPVAVNMIDLVLFFPLRRMESLRHNPMEIGVSDFPIAVQMHLKIIVAGIMDD